MIPTWQQRLGAMDHSKGTSNAMRQECMLAEIKELRKALRAERAKAERNKASSQRWRAAATKYQKKAAEKCK